MVLNITDLFHNFVFMCGLAGFVGSQVVKAIIAFIRMKDKRGKGAALTLLWSTGGMPSSHSSVVSALSASAAISEGFASPLFAVTFFFAMVIIRDALGVRRATGLQARALNILGTEMSERLKVDWQPVKEIQGHNPLEVGAGIVLGIVVTIVFYYIPFFSCPN
jgi:acid phosphatase family membrane protein YuiD